MEARAELPPICLRPFIRAMHPRREVLERLQQAEVTTYRTDEEGAVSFYLDGKSVTPDVALIH